LTDTAVKDKKKKLKNKTKLKVIGNCNAIERMTSVKVLQICNPCVKDSFGALYTLLLATHILTFLTVREEEKKLLF
jgi:hypothetical protein